MKLKISVACLAAVLLMSAPVIAAPGDRIGSAVSVVDLVKAVYATDTRILFNGDSVRQNELIEVGPNARSEIKLDDDTKLALGPGSRLLLDKFVYNPNKSGNAIILNVLEGTFRFITGVAQKPSYVIRTPSAAITVRGTIYDVYVQKSGEAWVLLHEGAVRVCNNRGACRDLDEPGKMMPVTEEGEIGNSVRWASLGDIDPSIFDRAFPFVLNPPSLDTAPIFTREALLEPTSYVPDKPDKKPSKPKREAMNEPIKDKTAAAESAPRRTPKIVQLDPPKTRRIVKVEDGDEVTGKPAGRIRFEIPRRRIKVVEKKPVYYTDGKRETGRRLVKAALGTAAVLNSIKNRNRMSYPSRTSSGGIMGSRMGPKSGLGGSMLK